MRLLITFRSKDTGSITCRVFHEIAALPLSKADMGAIVLQAMDFFACSHKDLIPTGVRMAEDDE